jgi:hypothetical protein
MLLQMHMMKDFCNAVTIPTIVGIATKSATNNAAANNNNLATTTSLSRINGEPFTFVHEDCTLVHPFIRTRDNWMDNMLLRALIVEQPFDAPYDKQPRGCVQASAITLLCLWSTGSW